MAGRNRGVKRYQPTDDDRMRVRAAVAMGLSHAQIAQLVIKKRGGAISERTLRNHFRDELQFGRQWLHVEVHKTIAQRALNPGGDVLLMFYAKTQMGWNDRPEGGNTPPGTAEESADAIRCALRDMDDSVADPPTVEALIEP